jgi:hypothetical protein
MPSTNPIRETQINNRLEQIHRHLSQIADIEAKAAPFKGIGPNGEFDAERQRLIEETDRMLDELQSIAGLPKYHPAP